MIEGFKKQTHELTDHEMTFLLPKVVKGLKFKIGKKNAVKNSDVCRAFVSCGFRLTPPRFRKIINHIRIHGLILNLIATSGGYYIATSQSECERFIESLDQRINSITRVRDAMFYQKNQTIKNE